MNEELDLNEVLRQAFLGPDSEELKEIREIIKSKKLTYECLLDLAANLFWDLSRSDYGLEYLAEEARGYIAAEKLLLDRSIDADKRLSSLEQLNNKAAIIAMTAASLRKSVVAAQGGKAVSKKREAENASIVEKYLEHTELHELSANAAASSLIDKYPELTGEIKNGRLTISQRRISGLIKTHRNNAIS